MTATRTSTGLWILAFTLFLNGCHTQFHPYSVASESMLPLLHRGDKIFVDESEQACSDLHDGTIVALRRGDAIVLKRILALPGETIRGDHRKIFRNGKQIDEPYLAPPMDNVDSAPVSFAPRTISPGEIFVMGDNRDRSLDSREPNYAVHFSDVVGRYTWTYWHAK